MMSSATDAFLIAKASCVNIILTAVLQALFGQLSAVSIRILN